MVIVLRTTDDVLRWADRLVEPPLRAAVGRLPEPSREVAELRLGRPSGDAGPNASLYRALTLVCAAAVGGDPHDAVPAAVAVELMHHWSAIRRDLVDGPLDGAPWTVGTQPAALGGEALLALAFDVIATGDPTRLGAARHGRAAAVAGAHASLGRPRQRPARPDAPGPDRAMMRVLGDTVQELLHGQHASLALRDTPPGTAAEERTDLLRDCLAMVEQRTGALFGCACALGAVAGGGDAAQVERLHLFGVRLGLAVQFAEDLLGIWAEDGGPGRPAYPDLRRRRRSLPVAAAIAAGADELGALLEARGRLSDADAERAAKTIEQSGARDWCRRQAEELLSQALLALDLAFPAPAAVAELIALARRATIAPR
ncbi:polyprenyl synthetase family protein [Dactylosporangium sp. CA-139066]|uniref:polyprenyl synthetase family protein n=1 Tax=Dactylosporangium sp. CA-139066 TaxID=3239930 RepID=UPI003D8CF6FD